MSNAARVIDLEEFRRRRDERRPAQTATAPVFPPVMWCWVWVPVWPVA